jgi:group I intron endonuclease
MNSKLSDKSGIYAFRNLENGKVYVGQSKNVLTRKKQHERGDTNNSRRFHNAMNKHGAEGFEFTVLEYCAIELLDEREGYWIVQLNSLYPNGYNLTTGGGAFQKHHEETKKKFSENQKKRYQSGEHLFASPEFQQKNSLRQKEEVRLGTHITQQPEFKEKRRNTVQKLIDETGVFFRHSTDEIERKRKQQQELYAQGKGKFQDPKLIEHNRQLVKQKLADGTHHSQQSDWSEKASKAAEKQKKCVVLAIRTIDGETIERKYPSINEAENDLEMGNSHLSALCNHKDGVNTLKCNLGRVIRGAFGENPKWDLSELRLIPDTEFTRSIRVVFTIQQTDESIIFKTYDSINQGCIDLNAQSSAVKWIRRGKKYKSTKCGLGRIIKVEDI